jgi:hypothetical protein
MNKRGNQLSFHYGVTLLNEILMASGVCVCSSMSYGLIRITQARFLMVWRMRL